MMTKFVLLVFLAHSNGTVSMHAKFHTGADLCLAERDIVIAELTKTGADPKSYSVQCVDSTLIPRLNGGKPA